MNSTKDANRSLVIPKWLPLDKAIGSPENEIPRVKSFSFNKKTHDNLLSDYNEFISSPNTLIASDLLSSASVLNEMQIVNEVSEYLMKQENVHLITKNLLKRILSHELKPQELSIERQISFFRNKLKDHPKNALYWIELGRLYTIKGEKKKAFNAITVAVNLAPFTRFIVRSAFRFFLHTDELERAYFYVKKALGYSSDPWLKSLEINAAILNDYNLSKLKKFNTKLIPDNLLFHYSELVESIGMVELYLGNINKAKKKFKLAWNTPTENVIAHGEWIIRNKFPALLKNSNLDFSKSYEAHTWRCYQDMEFEKAVTSSYQWLFEEPYSSHPYLACAHMLYSVNKLQDSIEILKKGLIIGSEDFMIQNNLAFTFLKNNDTKSAYDILKNISTEDLYESIFYLATSGLFYFKLGQISKGRTLYLESIELAKKSKNEVLRILALLNYAIAEVEVSSENAIKITNEALLAAQNSTKPNILIHKKKLEDLLLTNFNTEIRVK